MPDIPNYNQSSVVGDSWQRCNSISINNPYNGSPTIVFREEKVYILGDKIIREDVDNLYEQFDSNNPVHLQLYSLLNDEYIKLRTDRDNLKTTIVVEEPIV